MQVLSAALCERRILFVGDNVSTLSSFVLAMIAILHPFNWQHIFIPILPAKLIDFITAPCPFIIGIKRSHYAARPSKTLEGIVVIDVDSGDLTLQGEVLDNTIYCL